MNAKDTYVNNRYMFCVGVAEGGKYYISIPVSNARVDYEEYYEIEAEIYEQVPSNIEELKKIADKCRRRKNDSKLLELPGRDRGEPFWPEE